MLVRYAYRVVVAVAMAMVLALTSVVVAAAEESHPEQAVEEAAVEIDGVTLFQVRGTSGFPAEVRAAGIARRVEAAARDSRVDPASVRVEASQGLTRVFAGATRIMVVTEADAQLEQMEVTELARDNERRVRGAIVDYRKARTPERFMHGVTLAAAATLLYLVAVALTVWMTVRLRGRVESALNARIQTVGIQSFAVVRAERARTLVSALLGLVRVLVLLALTFAWLVYVLAQFPLTIGVSNKLLDQVIEPLATLGSDFLGAIPNVIFLVILYFILRSGLRLIGLFFEAVERGTVKLANFEPEWVMPTYKIVRFAVIVLGLVIAYPYIPGSDSPAFKGISLFLGVVFSLGSSTAISNIIAGYMITYRRAFRVGDRVKIGDVIGDVTAMRLQVLHLRTPKNEEVVIPNSQIVNGHVTNYSTLARDEGLLLHTSVGIGYDIPWRQVEALLLEAARRTHGIAAKPVPFVLQMLLGDFAVNYQLNVSCDEPRRMLELYSALHRNILDVFNEYGVAIMTPAYRSDPQEPKVVPKEKWYLSPAEPISG